MIVWDRGCEVRKSRDRELNTLFWLWVTRADIFIRQKPVVSIMILMLTVFRPTIGLICRFKVDGDRVPKMNVLQRRSYNEACRVK